MRHLSYHTPVLLSEVVAALRPAAGNRVIDATIDGGGHARALLRHVGEEGRLLGLDRDPAILEELRAGAAPDIESGRLRLVATSFANLEATAAAEGFIGADAILLDLGLSSYHLTQSGRGFSFERDEPLDLRFDVGDRQCRPAADLVRRLGPDALTRIIATYGEERHARRIARHITRVRVRRPIVTATAMRDCVLEALPPAARRHASRSVARVFQALRIVTNSELDALARTLPQILTVLRPGGRVAIIAFHSLEDRLVKRFFRCAAGEGKLIVLTKKPLRPSAAELRDNPRASSARMRIAERRSASRPAAGSSALG